MVTASSLPSHRLATPVPSNGRMSNPESPSALRLAARASRRRFLTVTGAAAALAFSTNLPGSNPASAANRPIPQDPFTLGVASGEPLSDSVVLWTRLAPQPFEPLSGMEYRTVEVQWQIARDERMRHVERAGIAKARPEFGHSVHVEARGLRPDHEYFYRFRVGKWLSPIGRTRTAPLAGSRHRQVDFAFASCQSWPDGYFTAHRHLAREDLDVLFFLGDYLYEYGISANGGSRNTSTVVPEQFRSETDTLDRYRLQYALYKSDPDLQAAHQAFPWIVTWDDHEVENNYAADIPENSVSREDFLVRRANAYRAYWENLPLRAPQLPSGWDMQLYRRYSYADLVDFHVLDTRQFRANQASGDGWKVDSPERQDPTRTFLGAEQEKWLLDGLRNSDAVWNVLPQQVIFSQMDLDPTAGQLFNMDAWDGYPHAQKRIHQALADASNPVVLTGDVHSSYAFDIKADWSNPDSRTIGVELVGTSISSGRDGTDISANGQKFLDANPHLKLVNERRGYVRCRVDRTRMDVDYRMVPYVVDRDDAPVSTLQSFAVEAGAPGLEVA